MQRVAGTALGAVIGIILLHLIGHGHNLLVLALIVVVVSVGVLGLQHYYFFFVTFLTIALVQLYAMSTPDSGTRLAAGPAGDRERHGHGGGHAVCRAALPVDHAEGHTARPSTEYLNALEQLLTQIAERWRTPGAQVRLRGAARAVDAALYQIRSTVRPVIRLPVVTRNKGSDHVLALLGTAGGHARTLAATADIDIHLDAVGERTGRADHRYPHRVAERAGPASHHRRKRWDMDSGQPFDPRTGVLRRRIGRTAGRLPARGAGRTGRAGRGTGHCGRDPRSERDNDQSHRRRGVNRSRFGGWIFTEQGRTPWVVYGPIPHA